MRILFFCTAHNSLSQRLYLALCHTHWVTVEYALSGDGMIEAAKLAKPDLIICPFLTTRVPEEVYETHLTLIIHPGPPGDAGPSSLDWVLMGDDGTQPDSNKLLQDDLLNPRGRTHWGLTVLQAIKEFDAGQIWAFDQFPLDINDQSLTKSSLYRGPITRAALSATLAAIARIETAAAAAAATTTTTTTTTIAAEPGSSPSPSAGLSGFSHVVAKIHAGLTADPSFATLSVTTQEPFRGGPTHHRPLLKAVQRDFSPLKHPAADVSRRIRCSDSQPGCLSTVFGPKLYLYGGVVETNMPAGSSSASPGSVVQARDDAVCISTCDGRGVWITHIRRVKRAADPCMWPKVPAAPGLVELGSLCPASTTVPGLLDALPRTQKWSRRDDTAYQPIWVDFATCDSGRVAYVHFDFYNGAMSTAHCERLVRCLEDILDDGASDQPQPLAAVVLMGSSSYFSNGIHLNVIETASDPALESWHNINAINDVVEIVMHRIPSRGIPTVAVVRGNCAAGGVALAAACDLVLAGEHVVLNPAYRALGLYGSEYHTLSYPGRCGPDGARAALRSMLPLSADGARRMGLVDHVLPGTGDALDAAARTHVETVLQEHQRAASSVGQWKQTAGISPSIMRQARASELAQMSMDFWSARSRRYHSRRRDFVRKVTPSATPLRFALHRRSEGVFDEEELDSFDSVEHFAQEPRRHDATALTKTSSTQSTLLPPASSEVGAKDKDCEEKRAEDLPEGGKTKGRGGRREKRSLRTLFSCYYHS